MAAASTSTSSLTLKEYLKKYESGADDQKEKKKKKKKKREKPKSEAMGGVLILDEDPVWQKPVQLDEIEEDDDSAGEEKPQIDEDVEVKRMKRLEAIRARKPYYAISEDGSGWSSVSDLPKPSDPAGGVSDISPPRQRRARFDTPSPGREQKAPDPGDSDLSPPRERRRFHTPSPEPQPREPDSGDGAADLSPRRRKPTEDLSPPRRARKRSREVGDLLPSRRKPREDLSPARHTRKQSLEVKDLSPPRREATEDLSPCRRSRKRSQDFEDHSPPRRKLSEDVSPPRRTRNRSLEVEDLSPPRRNRKGSLDDLSPPRRGRKELMEDLSPPRRVHRRSPEALRTGEPHPTDLSPPRRKKEPPTVKEARRTGLLSAEEIRKEIEKKKKEELIRFATMDPALSGRGAEAVFRDKEGKRISKEELLKAQEEEKPKEKKLEWGKGLAQKREAEARTRELELEKDKPFARTKDDPELDKMLKERIRWGDPMAHLVKRRDSELVLEDLGSNEKMQESGFIVPQTIPNHSWIKRGIDFPPNRYGIRPGRHWDGVDRSNGYEKELFKRQNEKRATQTEAYLWSVSDM